MDGRGSERREGRAPARWIARILVPVLLALAGIATVLVVNGSIGGADGDGANGDRDRDGREPAASTTGGCEPDAQQAVEDGYYVIEIGDDLSTVAARTCIEVEELIELNPNLDPQLIQPGNCVDLRADGCKALADQG